LRAYGAAVLLVIAACGGDGAVAAELTFDPCEPLAISAPAVTAAQAAGIDEALALWQAHGLLALATREPVDAAVVPVVFETAAPQMHGAYDHERGMIYVNVDLAGEPLAIVIAHELGHALGLLHVDGRASLMNKGNLDTPPTADDRLAVEALWGACVVR
jgi:hypothetical protein